jgi:RNase H-fold protein (predicted Holliday junction resolvase)
LPISYEPEFLTSQQAARITGENEKNDASAAAIILQSYLEKQLREKTL